MLKERNKKITHLIFSKGKTYKEVAEKFSISPQRVYDIVRREMTRDAKVLRAWAVLYKSEVGVGGIDFRRVQDGLTGEEVFYPRIFLTESEARNYGRTRPDYKNFRVVPCNISY